MKALTCILLILAILAPIPAPSCCCAQDNLAKCCQTVVEQPPEKAACPLCSQKETAKSCCQADKSTDTSPAKKCRCIKSADQPRMLQTASVDYHAPAWIGVFLTYQKIPATALSSRRISDSPPPVDNTRNACWLCVWLA